MAKIPIVGGGFGGVVAAESLARKLEREHQIVLVSRSRKFLFYPALVRLAFGRGEPDGKAQSIYARTCGVTSQPKSNMADLGLGQARSRAVLDETPRVSKLGTGANRRPLCLAPCDVTRT